MPRQLYGAIEAGGTKFVCAAGFSHNEILDEIRIPTAAPAETLGAVVQFFERVERELGSVQAFGIASFGPLDLHLHSPNFGCLLQTPKACWSGTNLIAPLRGRFGCAIAIDTDVNVAALAEAQFGAGIGTHSLAYVTVGTGIGGGAVIGGQTVKGLLHPEMGHLYVRRDARDENFAGVCPFHGDCVEGLASGPAILARWRENVDDWTNAHPGFEIIGGYLGQLAASITLVLSCERIIFGGGVIGAGRLMPYVRKSYARVLNNYLPIEAIGDLDNYIVTPGLSHRSGIAGAFLLASEAARRSLRL
jgi:fructokinase